MKKGFVFSMALAACLVAAPAAANTVEGESGVESTLTPAKKTTKKKTTTKKTTTKKSSTKTKSSKTSTAKTTAAQQAAAQQAAAQEAAQKAAQEKAQQQAVQSSNSGSNILGGLIGAAAEVLGGGSSSSQSTGSSSSNGILSALSTIFDATKTASKNQLVGTWTYTEPAVVFTSSNVLKNIGGKAVSSTIEKQLQSQLEKFGIKKGTMSMTFDKDGNFTQTLGGKTMSGTYTVKNKQVVLKYAGNVQQFIGTTQLDGNDLLIVMDASKLLKYGQALGALTGNSILSTAGNLLGSMDGMEVGLKLNK